MGNDHHDSHSADSAVSDEHEHGFAHGYTETDSHALPGGVTLAANGLQLDPSETHIDSRSQTRWRYWIRDENGNTVTEFEEIHDQLAHLILVRRDLTRFQHLHPDLSEDGAWSVEFTLPDPGVYRAFVDVLVDGRPTTLGIDLLSSGSADYETLSEPTRTVMVDDYEVTMTSKEMSPHEATTLEFKVRDSGETSQLEPYLGALGHLVALRDGDLVYLHVHPEETDPMDGIIRFGVLFPTPGRYRLFLQARPRGDLITVSFDVRIQHP